MRRIFILGALTAACAGGVFVACGLDESGQQPPDGSPDVSVMADAQPPLDAPIDVPIDVPQGCTTLDATACLDAGVPDGWEYAGFANAGTPCPSTADYVQEDFVSNLQLEAGACTCGACSVSASYTCAGKLTVSSNGSSCGDSVTFDAGDQAGCFDVSGINNVDDHVQSTFATSGPTLVAGGCDAGVVGNKGYSANSVTVCIPTSCSANYCGLKSPFRSCILTTGPVPATCPAPFTFTAAPMRAGSTSNISVNCMPCACGVSPSGGCDASVTAWDDQACMGNKLGSVSGTCGKPKDGTTVNGVFFTPSVPAAKCTNNNTGNGNVDFTAAVGICCL